MNIKEIKVNKANKSIAFINNGIAFSQFGVADEILDLITNLQEENEMLKKPIIVNWKNAHKIKVKSPLQARIDKAIEYLKDNACYENTISELFCDDLDTDSCMELLDILRGDNNGN